jgi:holo-[acyl-carrier protein] synthase
MNVYAIGVDLCEIGRINRIIEEHGERFLIKVFTTQEIAYCRKKYIAAASFAARFAAKEALLKAIGTGLRGKFRWKDIEIINNKLGKPEFTVYGKTARILKGRRLLLSLSHTADHAIAFVVVV